MLRVTDPKTETTPTTSQSPKQKDPKKVAAGRAGAAARKTKQALLLEELRKAKESQRNAENTSGAPPGREVEDFVAHPPKEKKEAPASHTADSTTLWILGAAAGLGLAYWATLTRSVVTQRAPVDPPALPPKKSSPDGSVQQLEVVHSPFYME